MLDPFNPRDDWMIYLRVIMGLVAMVSGAWGYTRYSSSRKAILSDPEVMRDLTAEQRLRLQLGLLETTETVLSPEGQAELLNHPELARQASQLREASRQRERGIKASSCGRAS